MSQRLKYNTAKLDFEVDYLPSSEFKEMYMEERTIKRDNTRIAAPKILFSKY